MQPAAPQPASTGQRWGDAAIGALQLGCALALLLLSALDWMALLAVAALLALGLHALHSAWRARPSLLSRLGPLP
jgi:hypothetical protein